MATKYFCDKCGQSCSRSDLINIKTTSCTGNYIPFYQYIETELCKRCVEKVKNFIEGNFNE